MAADPSFRGFVETTLDALLIFEGCRRGVLPKITRRLQEFEKRALVVSGAVFVFDEEETGIKRWTDGLSWSPSRTLGNFLVYRELDKKANAAGGPDEGNNSLTDNLERAELSMGAAVAAAARAAAGAGDDEDQVDDDEKPDVVPPVASTSKAPAPSTARRRSLSDTTGNTPPLDRARERALVGSLTSTYRFRSDGLVKKTISLSGLHMIGYYCIDDVTSGRLRTPSSHSELISLEVSSDFLSPTLFRVPPIVEIGADGQLKYKGESDTPMSPMTRSGSSQGFTTPALTQQRSRPPSSESVQGRASSPRLQSIATGSTSQRDHSAPNSPHRGSTGGHRASNRFDPYAVGRSSPNLSSYNQATNYPFPDPPRQHSPNRNSFPNLSGADLDPTYRSGDGSSGLSPAMGMLSSSASSEQQWGNAGASQHQSVQLSRQPTNEQSPPTFYQPRHAIPFDPDPPPSAGSNPNTSVFAYQPPPPNASANRPQPQPPARRHSPPLAYTAYSTASPQLSSSGSTYHVNPPSSFSGAANHRSLYDGSLQQSHPTERSLSGGVSSYNSPSFGGRPESSHASGLLPSLSSSLPASSSQYDYLPPGQQQPTTYSSYSMASPSMNPYGSGSGPPGHYGDPRQPSGMVAGFVSEGEDEVVGASTSNRRMGLGLGPHGRGIEGGGGGGRGGAPQRYEDDDVDDPQRFGARVKREPGLESDLPSPSAPPIASALSRTRTPTTPSNASSPSSGAPSATVQASWWSGPPIPAAQYQSFQQQKQSSQPQQYSTYQSQYASGPGGGGGYGSSQESYGGSSYQSYAHDSTHSRPLSASGPSHHQQLAERYSSQSHHAHHDHSHQHQPLDQQQQQPSHHPYAQSSSSSLYMHQQQPPPGPPPSNTWRDY